MIMLNDAQIDRYSRQIVLPEIGGRGQEVLLRSAVCIVGSGEVASTAALYLGAAGIGRILCVAATAHDAVATATLAAAVAAVNPEIAVEANDQALTAARPHPGFAVDVFVETTGDRSVLARINDLALTAGRPLVTGVALAGTGVVSVYRAHAADGACALCRPVEPSPAPDAVLAGILGPAVAGSVGSLLALEVVKLCLGLTPAGGVRLRYAAAAGNLQADVVVRNPDCPACARLLGPTN